MSFGLPREDRGELVKGTFISDGTEIMVSIYPKVI